MKTNEISQAVRIFLFLAAMLLPVVMLAEGPVLFETQLPPSESVWNTSGWGYAGAPDKFGIQYIPPTDQEVCTVKIGVNKANNPVENVTLMAYEGNPGSPVGGILRTVNLNPSQIPAGGWGSPTPVYATFPLETCLALSAGHIYSFIVSLDGISNTNIGGYMFQFTSYSGINPLSFFLHTTSWRMAPFNWKPAFRLEGFDPDSEPTPTPQPTRTPVLVIPGIAGTELYNGGDLIWADLGEMFSDNNDEFLTDNLLLDNLGNTINEISTGPVMEKIFRVPLLNVNIFEGLRLQLEDNGYIANQDIFYFPYDWRLNLDDSKNFLDQKIRAIKLQTGATRVDVIAHSMGGLLVKDYADAYGKDDIDKLIFVGTPHLGAPKAAKVLLEGDRMGIPWLEEDRLQEIAENSPAVYELLPNTKYFSEFSGYIWPAKGHGFINYEGSKNFLLDNGMNSTVMDLSESFRGKNLEDVDLSGIDVYNFAGCRSGTQAAYHISDDGEVLHVGQTSGDSTVPLVSADYLNISSANKFYLKNANHSEMPSQEDVRGAILDILHGDPVIAEGDLEISKSVCNFKGKQLTWHSPVEVHVYDSQNRHTGPIGDNAIEYGIPGVGYDVIGHNKFVFLSTDSGEEYHIVTNALSSGSFDLLISENDNSTVVSTVVYNDVLITASTAANFDVSATTSDETVNLDYDGDGTFEVVAADAVLDEGEALDIVAPVTQATVSGSAGLSGWYVGDVQVSLTASDDNSGILETLYSIDGSVPALYLNPFTIAQDGVHTVIFYSADRAGNNEAIKSVEIKIDKTAPEIGVQFDLNTDKFVFSAAGASIGCSLMLCTAVDEAGNTTTLLYVQDVGDGKRTVRFTSINYNGTTYLLPENLLSVLVERSREGVLRDFDQTFIQGRSTNPNVPDIRIDYRVVEDLSYIAQRFAPDNIQHQTVSGKRFLRVETESGKIVYTF